MKKILRVYINDIIEAECVCGESVYQVLADNGFALLGHCNGNAFCKKCYVEIEEQIESEQKRKKVLACEYLICKPINIYTGENWKQLDKNGNQQKKNIVIKKEVQDKSMAIGVAVDVGSTTIGISCMDLKTKKEFVSFSFFNPQYLYGADVISRIQFCIEQEEQQILLKNVLNEKIQKELKQVLGDNYACIQKIVYSGNTTMQHILRDLPVNGLAHAPFKPVNLEYVKEDNGKIEQIYPPGFSAFVGADILVGAAYLNMGKEQTYDLLIDLGTNGEMLLLNQQSGFATSTACGPVFDSVSEGAVYGSEMIHAMATCIKRHLIDASGMIVSPFFEKGIEIDKGFVIRQENVRNFQLAKGAIYSGIYCLMEQAGITLSDIGKVYISGGLGFYLQIRDAVTVKMLPKEFIHKVQISGNTSLEGAKQLVIASDSDESWLAECERIKRRTISFELANHVSFQKRYMQSLGF